MFINEKTEVTKETLRTNFLEAKKNKLFLSLLKKLELSEKEAIRITSKLQDVLKEIENCEHCTGLNQCKNPYKGHFVIPEKKEGKLYFSYAPCKYQNLMIKANVIKDQKSKRNLNARMKDIDVTGDKKRLPVIKWLDTFYQNYDYAKTEQGLYLHGSYGTGKTFFLDALFHELQVTKDVDTECVYFPEVLRTLKDDWELYEVKMKRFQNVSLLLLDDIGAEKVTEWGRDEVLGTILQYRMDHGLPTFFTSNMNLVQLETHLATIANHTDYLKARRIIERIKEQAIPMELVSENRRSHKDIK